MKLLVSASSSMRTMIGSTARSGRVVPQDISPTQEMDVDPSAPRDRACHGRERRSLDLAVYQTLERYDTPLGPDENVLCGEPGLRLHATPHVALELNIGFHHAAGFQGIHEPLDHFGAGNAATKLS